MSHQGNDAPAKAGEALRPGRDTANAARLQAIVSALPEALLVILGYILNGHISLEELLNARDQLRECCVLLELPLPGTSDLQGFDQLRRLGIALSVIAKSGTGDVAATVGALKDGATDLIERPFRETAVVDALAGAVVKPANGALVDDPEDAQMRLDVLTPRERDVLQGLAHGCSNKVIAYELGISPRTVEIHRGRMMKQLGVRSVSHALRLAFAAGLGSDEAQRRPN